MFWFKPWIFEGLELNARIIQPDTVQKIDNNTLQLTFNESVRGVAAVAGSASRVGVSYINEYNGSSWNIEHNLGTSTPSGYNPDVGPVVMHWDMNGYRIIPDINDDPNDNTFITQWNIPVSAGSIVRRSDYIHYQYDPSTVWNVNHNLNSWVIVQCYDIIDDEEITPDKVEVVDQRNLRITFAENKRGYAHVIQVLRDRVVYSPYACDITGLGICPDVLGYWKIGTGTNSLWNPYLENDLETPVTSGAFKSVEQDSRNYYIDFVVPSDYQDVGIREVGLFNFLGEMMFYSKCTEIFKPEDTQGYFHYRITKFGYSSSSSSSSSLSSSSSSSSFSSSSFSSSSSSSSSSESSSSSSSSLSSSSSSLSSSSSSSSNSAAPLSFTTSFSEYPTGAGSPTGWTEIWSASGDKEPYIVESLINGPPEGILYGTKTLEFVGTSDDEYMLVLDASNGLTDFEILTLLSTGTNSNNSIRVNFRAIGKTPTETYYYVQFQPLANNALLRKVVNGVGGGIDSVSKTFNSQTWYWHRIRCQGTSISASVWEYGASEPAGWNLTGTDSDIASGWVGIAPIIATYNHCDYFRIEEDFVNWPIPVPPSGV
jgi:hypothetical protein